MGDRPTFGNRGGFFILKVLGTMNQLQENESSNEGREIEGMEFLEESPLESIKKFNI